MASVNERTLRQLDAGCLRFQHVIGQKISAWLWPMPPRYQ